MWYVRLKAIMAGSLRLGSLFEGLLLWKFLLWEPRTYTDLRSKLSNHIKGRAMQLIHLELWMAFSGSLKVAFLLHPWQVAVLRAGCLFSLNICASPLCMVLPTVIWPQSGQYPFPVLVWPAPDLFLLPNCWFCPLSALFCCIAFLVFSRVNSKSSQRRSAIAQSCIPTTSLSLSIMSTKSAEPVGEPHYSAA